MKKLLIANTVYGKTYSDIFCKYHLRSMLDPTNIPALKDRVEYSVYTDEETLPWIQSHPNFQKLAKIIPCEIFKFSWPENANRYAERYRAQIGTFKMQVREALDKGCYLSSLAADLFVAKGWVQHVLESLDSHNDAVFSVPMRSAFEPMSVELDKFPDGEAPTPFELFALAYANMHPLWVASHWDAPQFTKIPYTLLWNSWEGLIARSFSVSPVAFVPDDRMLSIGSVLDVELPAFFKNPFWAKDWIHCPIIGIEPLNAFYPPFANRKASEEWVAQWASRTLHPTQLQNIRKPFYFPSQFSSDVDDLLTESNLVVNVIMGENT